MKLTIRRDLGGYALDVVDKAGIDGTVLDRPFTLVTGPNGSGKSATMRGIRATIGLQGERAGQLEVEFGGRPIDMDEAAGDIERMNTQVKSYKGTGAADHVPVVFDLKDLGWRGQPTYLFDSRAASTLAKASQFDTDMLYHASLLMDGGGSKSSHGQFVSKTWWEALGWAADLQRIDGGWSRGTRRPERQALLEAALDGGEPSTERWLFLDEPETAIDAEALLVGLSVLLNLAEVGKLRVICATHSLLFAAGLMHHPKVQVVDLGPGGTWLKTQEIVLALARDETKIAQMGQDILGRMRDSSRKAEERPKPARRGISAPKPPRGRKTTKARTTSTVKVAAPKPVEKDPAEEALAAVAAALDEASAWGGERKDHMNAYRAQQRHDRYRNGDDDDWVEE